MANLNISSGSNYYQNNIQDRMRIANQSSSVHQPVLTKTAENDIEKDKMSDEVHELQSNENLASDLNQRRNADPSELQELFSNNDYSQIGSTSDLNTLDVKRAISDMQRDSILQEYQYFVGNTQGNIKYSSEDGTVFLKS